MKKPGHRYFTNIMLLLRLRAGKVPPCLNTKHAETQLLKCILAALGAN